MGERPYLSIGEVLGMLLEEFPDVSISKIRFLESQGLIDPERTPSGYRKFYDADVDRLRVILREQRQNFLPLRVIRDRLESGQIDDSGPMTPPRGLRNVTVIAPSTVVPTSHHPAAQPQTRVAAAVVATSNGQAPVAALANGDSAQDTFVASELCARAGITNAQLADLVSFGLIVGSGSGANTVFSAAEVAIATAAAGFLARGVEARHLRHWRRSAEIEAQLFEQLVLPTLSQRNPQSRQSAATALHELASLGGNLRAAIVTAALQHHLEH